MADDDTNMEELPSFILEDQDKESTSEEDIVNGVVSFVQDRFNRAEDYRYQDEQRWLKAYRNYRGLYGPDVQFSETEKSRVFIKVTKTKVLAAYGQIVDVLFAGAKFPITIEPTKLPEGIVSDVHFDPKEPPQLRNTPTDTEETSPYGFAGDGQDLPAGATERALLDRLGSMADDLSEIEGLREGVGKTPTAVTFSPAMLAAKKMEKKIHDQLDESNANKHLRYAAFEMALFGQGVIKGPFAYDKEYANWDEDGEYSPVTKTVPKISAPSIWNCYPDPDAYEVDECEYFIERHKMSRTKLRALKRRPHFRKEVIEAVIANGPNYTKKYWEDDLSDYAPDQTVERFEVLEYWGTIDVEKAEQEGIELPDDIGDVDEVQANIWICGDRILRFIINPFKPAKIPYVSAPFELNPYTFFGVGIAENMDDTQTVMNGFMRMAIDNAALSGNLLIEVDESNLVPGQDLSVYPGKVFRRQGGAPGQAIFGTKFPNVSQENMMMFDKARQLADESTGLPSFAHGQTGVAGVGRTASGISMLMNAASGSTKNVIKNVDDYLLRPLGERLFHFNMQFDFDPEIKGDLEVNARGTESLMANEVRSQRLMTLLQVAGGNQLLAPYVKFDYIVREISKSLDLDPEKVTNDQRQAAVQAELMKAMGVGQQAGSAPAGANPMDPTGAGGGTMGTGVAPAPGEQGFTGNAGTPPQQGGAQGGGNEQAMLAAMMAQGGQA